MQVDKSSCCLLLAGCAHRNNEHAGPEMVEMAVLALSEFGFRLTLCCWTHGRNMQPFINDRRVWLQPVCGRQWSECSLLAHCCRGTPVSTPAVPFETCTSQQLWAHIQLSSIDAASAYAILNAHSLHKHLACASPSSICCWGLPIARIASRRAKFDFVDAQWLFLAHSMLGTICLLELSGACRLITPAACSERRCSSHQDRSITAISIGICRC